MRFAKQIREPHLVALAPESKQLLNMAEFGITADRAQSAPPIAIDTFEFLGNPFEDLATADKPRR